MATGIIGILASAREWCPLKSTPQKITHTIFLALSLVSLAIAQLVVALAATGAARDINNSEYEGDDEDEVRFRFDKIFNSGTTSGKIFPTGSPYRAKMLVTVCPSNTRNGTFSRRINLTFRNVHERLSHVVSSTACVTYIYSRFQLVASGDELLTYLFFTPSPYKSTIRVEGFSRY